MRESPAPRGRRVAAATLLICLGVILGSAGAWALTTVLSPPAAVEPEASYTLARAQEGEVKDTVRLNATATWAATKTGLNAAEGVVTEIFVASGDEVRQGQALYSVNLSPVVVAVGDVPAFRAVGAGTQGPDVQQVQQMLQDTGFYEGVVDGKAGAKTADAISRWQRSLHLPETGEVALGSVLFVPSLPSRIVINEETISRGRTLSPGEVAVSALSQTPAFSLALTEAQAAQVPDGATVELSGSGDRLWVAKAGNRAMSADSSVVNVELLPVSGGAICEDACAELPATAATTLAANVIVTPATKGVSIPTAALVTDADGRASVLDADGTAQPVEVLASSRGISIVTGVNEGQEIRVSRQ